jgi:hypothetical protein
MDEAMKYGTQVMTKLPVVKKTTLIAFHLLGCLVLVAVWTEVVAFDFLKIRKNY